MKLRAKPCPFENSWWFGFLFEGWKQGEGVTFVTQGDYFKKQRVWLQGWYCKLILAVQGGEFQIPSYSWEP